MPDWQEREAYLPGLSQECLNQSPTGQEQRVDIDMNIREIAVDRGAIFICTYYFLKYQLILVVQTPTSLLKGLGPSKWCVFL